MPKFSVVSKSQYVTSVNDRKRSKSYIHFSPAEKFEENERKQGITQMSNAPFQKGSHA